MQWELGHLQKEDVTTLAFTELTAGNAALLNSIGLVSLRGVNFRLESPCLRGLSTQGVITLLQHPDQLEELKNNPSLAPAVVNELLRYNTTSALNSRRAAKEDITIGAQVGGPHIQLFAFVSSRKCFVKLI